VGGRICKIVLHNVRSIMEGQDIICAYVHQWVIFTGYALVNKSNNHLSMHDHPSKKTIFSSLEHKRCTRCGSIHINHSSVHFEKEKESNIY
jgi:hypothetical protein